MNYFCDDAECNVYVMMMSVLPLQWHTLCAFSLCCVCCCWLTISSIDEASYNPLTQRETAVLLFIALSVPICLHFPLKQGRCICERQWATIVLDSYCLRQSFMHWIIYSHPCRGCIMHQLHCNDHIVYGIRFGHQVRWLRVCQKRSQLEAWNWSQKKICQNKLPHLSILTATPLTFSKHVLRMLIVILWRKVLFLWILMSEVACNL